MAQINVQSVGRKLRQWEKSSAGVKQKRDTINQYVNNDVRETDAGSAVLTRKELTRLADKFVEEVRKSAEAHDVPSSVITDIESAVHSDVSFIDGNATILINFEGILFRASLNTRLYTGVDNIIAVFNNGYPHNGKEPWKIEKVWGEWHGMRVHAIGSLEGAHFMQDAVRSFNKAYGAKYNITVELAEIYERA